MGAGSSVQGHPEYGFLTPMGKQTILDEQRRQSLDMLEVKTDKKYIEQMQVKDQLLKSQKKHRDTIRKEDDKQKQRNDQPLHRKLSKLHTNHEVEDKFATALLDSAKNASMIALQQKKPKEHRRLSKTNTIQDKPDLFANALAASARRASVLTNQGFTKEKPGDNIEKGPGTKVKPAKKASGSESKEKPAKASETKEHPAPAHETKEKPVFLSKISSKHRTLPQLLRELNAKAEESSFNSAIQRRASISVADQDTTHGPSLPDEQTDTTDKHDKPKEEDTASTQRQLSGDKKTKTSDGKSSKPHTHRRLSRLHDIQSKPDEDLFAKAVTASARRASVSVVEEQEITGLKDRIEPLSTFAEQPETDSQSIRVHCVEQPTELDDHNYATPSGTKSTHSAQVKYGHKPSYKQYLNFYNLLKTMDRGDPTITYDDFIEMVVHNKTPPRRVDQEKVADEPVNQGTEAVIEGQVHEEQQHRLFALYAVESYLGATPDILVIEPMEIVQLLDIQYPECSTSKHEVTMETEHSDGADSVVDATGPVDVPSDGILHNELEAASISVEDHAEVALDNTTEPGSEVSTDGCSSKDIPNYEQRIPSKALVIPLPESVLDLQNDVEPEDVPPADLPPGTTADVLPDVTPNIEQEVPADLPSATTPDVPSEATMDDSSETTVDVPTETSVAVPSEATIDVPQEATAEVPTEEIIDAQGVTTIDIPSHATIDVPQETTINVQSDTDTAVPVDINADVPQETNVEPEVTADVPVEVTIDVPIETTVDVQSQANADVPEETTADDPSETTIDVPPDVDVPQEANLDVPQEAATDVQPESTLDVQEESEDVQSQVTVDNSPETGVPPVTTADVQPEITTDVPPDTTKDDPPETTVDVPAEIDIPPETSIIDVSHEPTITKDVPLKGTTDVRSETTADVSTDTVKEAFQSAQASPLDVSETVSKPDGIETKTLPSAESGMVEAINVEMSDTVNTSLPKKEPAHFSEASKEVYATEVPVIVSKEVLCKKDVSAPTEEITVVSEDAASIKDVSAPTKGTGTVSEDAGNTKDVSVPIEEDDYLEDLFISDIMSSTTDTTMLGLPDLPTTDVADWDVPKLQDIDLPKPSALAKTQQSSPVKLGSTEDNASIGSTSTLQPPPPPSTPQNSPSNFFKSGIDDAIQAVLKGTSDEGGSVKTEQGEGALQAVVGPDVGLCNGNDTTGQVNIKENDYVLTDSQICAGLVVDESSTPKTDHMATENQDKITSLLLEPNKESNNIVQQ